MNEYIVTHNGPFHCDDVMAVAILRQFMGTATLPVIRTRDQSVIDKASVAVDVGGAFDPNRMRFDHHQYRHPGDRARSKFMPAVPLSSAGMVWEYFANVVWPTEVSAIVYRELIADIDLHDNGEAPAPPSGFPGTGSLSAAISRMNPNWNGEKDYDAAFEKAVKFAEKILRDAIVSAEAEVAAWDIIRSGKPLEGGKIVEINKAVPGAREMVMEHHPDAVFVVQPSDYGGYMVICVPPSRERGFEQRLPLPESWAGLRGEALNSVLQHQGLSADVLTDGLTASPGAVFTHTGRFCGGHGTKKATLAMAKLALRLG